MAMTDRITVDRGIGRAVFKVTGKTYRVGISRFSTVSEFFGKMSDPTCSACITGPCGETMELYLRIERDHIQAARFRTNGCGVSRLCGAAAAEMAQGRTIDDAAAIDGETIVAALGGIPEDHRHCAFLAAETLQAALHNHFAKPEFRHHEARKEEPQHRFTEGE